MDIRGKMDFSDAVLVNLNMPTMDGGDCKTVIHIKATATPEIAESLKRCGAIYEANGVIQETFKKDTPEVKLCNCELRIPHPTDIEGGYETFRPEYIHAFVFQRSDEDRVIVNFRAHIRGEIQAAVLQNFRIKHLRMDSKFEACIRSLQGEFEFHGDPGGTAVDMATGERVPAPLFDQPACALCDLGIPRNADGNHMKDSELSPCPRPNPEAEKPEPALASANHMGVRKAKQPKTRTEEPAFPVN